MEKHGKFDTQSFHDALDAERTSRKLNWKQVANEAGISASTLTRMAQGKRPDVDGLAALTVWSGLSADDFLVSDLKPRQPSSLAQITTYLRSDKNLSPEAAIALDELIKATYERLRNQD